MPITTEATKGETPNLLKCLLRCPNEIIVQVLAELHHTELLVARLASHAFHDLVHKHGSALARKYCEIFRSKHLLQDSFLHKEDDLSLMVQLSIRNNTATQLASVMADRISSKLHFRHTQYTDYELKAWKARKAKKLFRIFQPAMFILYYFFVNLRKSIWDVAERFSHLSDEDYLGLGQVFDLDQQYMIEQVKPDSLIDITESFRALQGVSSSKGLVIGRHGRIIPGTTTVRSHIAYGGFRWFADAVCSNCYSAGRAKYDALVEELWEPRKSHEVEEFYMGRNDRPLKTIFHLRDTQNFTEKAFTLYRDRDTQVKLIEKQSFWEKAALTVMQRKGILRRIDPDIPTIETWLRGVIAEKDDPWFEFGRWSRPDDFVA